MKVWALGLDFRSAPLELRAKAASSDPLKLVPHSSELIFVSTCNRVEIYAVSEVDAILVKKAWASDCGFNAKLENPIQVFEEADMVQHLFRVTASMDSMVVGETQITSQIKRAYEDAVSSNHVGPIFHRCFQRAFQVAKKVRQRTEVGRLAVSIPSIGVKLAEKVLGSLQTKSVGILGLGEIGRVAAEHFASIRPKKIFLFNRTRSVADEMAHHFDIETQVCDRAEEVLHQSDVIVSAADAVLVKKEDLRELDQRGNPVFVLDLSVPRSVEVLSDLERTFTFGIDDLQKIAEENQSLRSQELYKAEQIIEEEVKSCWIELSPASISQTFGRLTSKMEKMTMEELSTLRARLGSVSEKDWAQIEKMAYRLTSKVLQDPMKELRLQVERNAESESLLQFFRNIFKI